MPCLPSPKHNGCLVAHPQTLQDRPMICKRSGSGNGKSHYLAATWAHMTERQCKPRQDLSGQFITKKDDRCNTGTRSLGSILGRHAAAGVRVLLLAAGKPWDPASVLPLPVTSSHEPLGGWEVCSSVLSWSMFHYLLEIWKNGETLLRAWAHQWPHVLVQGCTPEYLVETSRGKPPKLRRTWSPPASYSRHADAAPSVEWT